MGAPRGRYRGASADARWFIGLKAASSHMERVRSLPFVVRSARGNFIMRTLLLAAAVVFATPAYATNTWCAFVREDVAAGYLSLRASPSTDAPCSRKLLPGDFLEISTGQCHHRLNADRQEVGDVCASSGSKWVPVENVPRLDHGGWVNEGYIVRVACESSKVDFDNGTLLYYDADCDGPHECTFAMVGCEGETLSISFSMDQKDVSAWFAISNGVCG